MKIKRYDDFVNENLNNEALNESALVDKVVPIIKSIVTGTAAAGISIAAAKSANEAFKQLEAGKLGDKGKCVTDADLKAMSETVLGRAQKEIVKLEGFSVMTGDNVMPTATVKLNIDGVIKTAAKTGVGPVDAAINAIQSLVGETADIELQEYNIDAITGGTNALAEVFVIMGDKNGNKATGRSTTDDVVMASVEAVLDSINKILIER